MGGRGEPVGGRTVAVRSGTVRDDGWWGQRPGKLWGKRACTSLRAVARPHAHCGAGLKQPRSLSRVSPHLSGPTRDHSAFGHGAFWKEATGHCP